MGYGKLQGIRVCLEKCKRSLTKSFVSANVSSVHSVYEEFKNNSSELEEEIEAVLKVSRNHSDHFHDYLSECNERLDLAEFPPQNL